MATTFKWAAPEAIVTYHTTALDGLASAAFAAAGPAVTNETDLYQYIDFEVVLAALSPVAGAFVDIWLLATLDATNYSDAAKPLQSAKLLCTIGLDTSASTAQRIVVTNIPIPPLNFEMQLRNMAGVSLGANSNTLKYRRHNEQGV